MNKTPQAAAIYARISEDRTGEALGVGRLRELCEAEAARRGWPVADVLIENDISAYKRRPLYQRLLTGMGNGTYDAVVVVDQDRLVRKPAELEHFIEVADAHRVLLADTGGTLNLSTPDGRLTARIRGSVAQHETEKRVERIRRQRDQAAKRGVPMGGRRAYGYEPDGMTVRAAEAAIILEVARRALAGETLTAIARDLNERGAATVMGGEWGSPSLRSMLGNPRYAGLRVHKGEVVGPAAWPAVLDREIHERLRVVLGDPRRSKRGRPPAYLLTGLLRCSECGSPLYGSSTGTRRRYLCDSGPNKPGCGRRVISSIVEDHLRDAVLSALAGPPLATAAVRQGDSGSADTVEELRIAELELEQWARDLAERLITRAEFLAGREVVVRRIERLRADLARDADRGVLGDLPTTLEGLHARWKRESVDWRRAVLQAVVDHVVVGPGVQGRRPFDPSRLTVVWRG